MDNLCPFQPSSLYSSAEIDIYFYPWKAKKGMTETLITQAKQCLSMVKFPLSYYLSKHMRFKENLHVDIRAKGPIKKIFPIPGFLLVMTMITLWHVTTEIPMLLFPCHFHNFWRETTGHSWLPVTRTLSNSNLTLTQIKIDFPWICSIHLV